MLRDRNQLHADRERDPQHELEDQVPGKQTLTENLAGPRPRLRGLITSSVGLGGRNKRRDVGAVQRALEKHGHSPGAIDRRVGPRTIASIKAFQARIYAHPDGLIEVGAKTELLLTHSVLAQPSTARHEPAHHEPAHREPAQALQVNAVPVTPAASPARSSRKSAALDSPEDVRETLARITAYESAIQRAAEHFHISPEDIRAIIGVESRGNPHARAGGPRSASGLMQVTEETWRQVAKTFPELAAYADFATHWSHPEINIMFGTATLASKRKSLERLGVPVDGPHFTELAVAAYNGGEGVVSLAMQHARSTGCVDPEADCLKFEHLSHGVEHAGESRDQQIWKYYMPGSSGAVRNKSGTREEAIRLKTEEILKYPTRISHYLDAERRDTANALSTNAPAHATTPAAANQREASGRPRRAQPEPTSATYEQIARNFSAPIPGTSLTWHDALYLPEWGRHALPSDMTGDSTDVVLAAIQRQALALEKLSAQFGRPLRVHSWLRPPAYNRKVRGAARSAHMRGTATDFHIDGISAEAVRRMLKAEPTLYPGAGENNVSWVHIDLEHHRWFNP